MSQQLECLQHSDECKGEVEWRMSPDREDMKAFPRCDYHWDKRLKLAEQSRDLSGDVAPDWFDPTYAGERWDDD